MENFIFQKILEGYGKRELYEQLREIYGYNAKYKSFGKRFLRAKKKLDSGENSFLNKYSNLISYLKKNNHSTIIDLSKDLNCDYQEVYNLIRFARTRGYEITINDENVILSKDRVLDPVKKVEQLETTEIIFGIASDLHFGSNCCQITNLHEFANICSKEGVKHIFVPGDVVAGNSVFSGQIHEIYAYTAREQENSVIRNLPKGQFKWYMIGGNHDYNFVKRSGHNPLRVIESERDDVVYCGFDTAIIPILNNVDLMMWHPSGGLPYSLSYRLQKGAEQYAIGELQKMALGKKDIPTLRFFLAGHLHVQLEVLIGNILALQCGCFEGQTNYIKRKGYNVSIGGYIVKASIGYNGNLKSFESKFHLFAEIENDWKSYSHEPLEKIIVNSKLNKPLFE